MISLNKKFLFIHVPKTGGNSIQNILKKYSEDNIVSVGEHQDGIERFGLENSKYKIQKHSTLEEYKKEIEPEIFKTLYKFSTIRNPWDMCISFYFSPHRGKIEWNRNDFRDFLETVPSVKKYIQTRSLIEKVKTKFHLKSKLNKPLDTNVNFLIRFENLNEDFKKVCDTIGIPFENLPHNNKSSKKHYTEYYDDELKEIVRNNFHDEISYGNYEFGQ